MPRSIGVIYGLRSDGTLWKFDEDFGLPLTPLEPEFEATVLVLGSERYVWLHEAIPKRPATAVECSTCHGIGKMAVSEDTGVCTPYPAPGANSCVCPYCRALGWVEI